MNLVNVNMLEKIKKEMNLALVVPMLILIILWIVIGIKNPRFIAFFSIKRIFIVTIPIMICAFGVGNIIRMGSIDLSIEGQVGFSSVLIAYLFSHGVNSWIIGVLITLIVAVLIGLINGLIYTKLRIPSFLSSLSWGYICLGFGNYIYKGQPIIITNMDFRNISLGSIFNLQITIIITIVVFCILFFLQRRTILGLYINTIGEKETLVKLNGINISRIKICSFAIAGFCYGLTGIILTSRLGSGMSNIGTMLLMNSIAAVIIGGTPMSGGSGSILGTLIGSFIITTLQTLVIIFRINPFYQDAIIGLVIILAILFSTKKGLLVIAK